MSNKSAIRANVNGAPVPRNVTVVVALGVLSYLYYERTKPVVKIDVPGVSGEITKEGVDVEIGKPKN
jgi:hypothetical protein